MKSFFFAYRSSYVVKYYILYYIVGVQFQIMLIVKRIVRKRIFRNIFAEKSSDSFTTRKAVKTKTENMIVSVRRYLRDSAPVVDRLNTRGNFNYRRLTNSL